MRVMLVIHGLNIGGAEVMVGNLSTELQALGHQVLVVSLASAATPLARSIRAAGVEVRSLNKRRGPDIRIPWRLKAVLRQFQPDVVHTHLPVIQYVWPAVVVYGRPVRMVHTFHSVAAFETQSNVLSALNRLFFSMTRSVPVALTPEAAEGIAVKYRLPQSRMRIVANGVPLGKYAGIAESRTMQQTVRLLHVGRLDPVKQQQQLLRVFAELTTLVDVPVHLAIVGGGPEYERLLAESQRLSISDKVTFAGPQDDVRPFYRDADVFILTSQFEAFPMTIIEAMATGLPVVSPKLPSLEGIVIDGVNGYQADPYGNEFARRLRALVEDVVSRRVMGAEGISTASRLSSGRMAERYVDLYS